MTSLHTLAIPPLIRGMHNITAILNKAQTSGIDHNTMLTARIHPKMLPFPEQILILTNMATQIPKDLNPSLPAGPYTPLSAFTQESHTFDALIARIANAIKYLESIKPEDLNGRESETVKLRVERRFAGNIVYVDYGTAEYVGIHAHPYFWFHVVTAYDLLRGCGVEIGKLDFLNAAGLHRFVFEPIQE